MRIKHLKNKLALTAFCIVVVLLFDGKLFGKKVLDYTVMILIALGFIINWIVNL